MPQAQTFSSRQSEPTAQMTGEEKVWVAEGSLGLVRAVRATYFFARITAFFTGDAVGCQKTVMLFSPTKAKAGALLQATVCKTLESSVIPFGAPLSRGRVGARSLTLTELKAPFTPSPRPKTNG